MPIIVATRSASRSHYRSLSTPRDLSTAKGRSASADAYWSRTPQVADSAHCFGAHWPSPEIIPAVELTLL
jgi:hypothetical protein